MKIETRLILTRTSHAEHFVDPGHDTSTSQHGLEFIMPRYTLTLLTVMERIIRILNIFYTHVNRA